jgi:hypothetical protein
VIEPEPFYFPSPDLFGHADAYRTYTGFASQLEEAGLTDRFPSELEVRYVAIELLAERRAVSDLVDMPDLIDEAIDEARAIVAERRSGTAT